MIAVRKPKRTYFYYDAGTAATGGVNVLDGDMADVARRRLRFADREAGSGTHLLARHVVDDLGYRRFEWKCDSCNEPSRRAAARLLVEHHEQPVAIYFVSPRLQFRQVRRA